MAQKLYADMTAGERLQWITCFTDFVNNRLEHLVQQRGHLDQKDREEVKVALNLIGAWQFAGDFVEKALRYGDFEARVGRLKMYFERCKTEVGKMLTITGKDGSSFALVKPTVPLRRRGRPTAAETEARKHGIEVAKPQDPEMEAQIMIARLIGIDVIVSPDAPREKNNAELKAEREAKRKKEEVMNPSLFDGSADAGNKNATSQNNEKFSEETQGAQQTMSMGEIYQDRIENERMHLSDIKWLCTKELQERIDNVRAQRTAFGDAAQTAKVLAERGASHDEIAVYAKQAEEAREAYEATYAAVDEEMAILHGRMAIDMPFVENFKQRFKGVDITRVAYITRPYYEKMKSPELDLRIKGIIERESPEYAAKMKAEEEKKREVAELLRYIKRKDKPNVKQRIETMEKRYARLVELLGEEEAKAYRPIVDAAIEDYEKNFKEEEEEEETPDKSTKQKDYKPSKQENNKPAKQESKKAKSKRGKSAKK